MEIFQTLAIDPGTRYTRIADVDTCEVSEEPTLIAVDKDGLPAATGAEAQRLLEAVPGSYTAALPMREGVIADIDMFEYYMRNVIKKQRRGRLSLMSPRAFVASPAGITGMQKSELLSAVAAAGARDVRLVEKPLAAAIGANEDTGAPHAVFCLSMGAGVSEAAVICMDRMIAYKLIRAGGDSFNDCIAERVRRMLDVCIGRGTAEKLKKDIGLNKGMGSTVVYARSMATGLPVLVNIDSMKIAKVLRECIGEITDAAKQLLVGMPNELYADIVKNGLLLTGGSSRIEGIEECFEQTMGIPARKAYDTDLAVIKGVIRIAVGSENRSGFFSGFGRAFTPEV